MPQGAIHGLRAVEIGEETAKGTAVAATDFLRCEAEITPLYNVFRAETPEKVLAVHAGPLAELDAGADVRLTFPQVTFEQASWLFALGMSAVVTAGAAPYTHTFEPVLSGLAAPKSGTLRLRYSDGTNLEELVLDYFMCRRLTLNFDQQGVLTAEMDCFAQAIGDAGITDVAPEDGVEVINQSQMIAYINTTWALAIAGPPPVGGSVLKQVISGSIEFDFGLEPWWGIGGTAEFQEEKETAKDVTVRLTTLADPNDTWASERTAAQAQTKRFLTFDWVGATAGNRLSIAIAATHERGELVTVGEQDGLDVVEMNLSGQYDPTGARLYSATVGNDRAAYHTPT